MLAKIVAKNFLSWESLEFDIKTGVTLVDGWNEDDQTNEGSGKSSIFNAVSWAAFGKMPKETNIDDVIQTGKKGCEVLLTFSDGSEIFRSRKPNELYFTPVGLQPQKGKDARETQALLETWLGLTFETFCQTVYFAQNYEQKFINSNQAAKAKILSEVQDLKIFDVARDRTKRKANAEEVNISVLNQKRELANKDVLLKDKDVEFAEAQIQTQKEKWEETWRALGFAIEREQAKLTEIKQQKQHDLQLLEREIETEKTQISAFGDKLEVQKQNTLAEIARLGKQITENDAAIRESEAKLAKIVIPNPEALIANQKQLQSAVWQNESSLTQLNQTIAEHAKLEKRGYQLGEEHAGLEKKINHLQEIIRNPEKSACPSCGTLLGDKSTASFQLQLAELETKAASIIVELEEISAKLEVEIASPEEIQTQIKLFKDSVAQVEVELAEVRKLEVAKAGEEATLRAGRQLATKLEAEVEKARSEIHQLNQTEIPTTSKKLETLIATLAMQRTAIETIDVSKLEAAVLAQVEFEAKPFVEDRSRLDQILSEKKAILADITKIDSDQAEAQTKVNRLWTLYEGFKEVKTYIFNSLLNEINVRTQHYLNKLFEVPVTLRFTNEDMEIITRIELDGVERSLGLLSGGQYRRVALATDLALSDVILARKGSKLGITIFDEYCKGLSNASMERVLSIFQERKEPTLMVEHNDLFKQIVQNSVLVTLTDSVSELS